MIIVLGLFFNFFSVISGFVKGFVMWLFGDIGYFRMYFDGFLYCYDVFELFDSF